MTDRFRIILVPEGLFGEEQQLFRRAAEAEEMVEEEIMQLVRADKVLGQLGDVALRVGRGQFGADRRIDDFEVVAFIALMGDTDRG